MLKHAILAATALLVGPGSAQEMSALCNATIRVGVRADAPPFSYRIAGAAAKAARDSAGEAACGVDMSMSGGGADGALSPYAGYTVHLCRAYLDDLTLRCPDSSRPRITAVEVPVSDRYAQLASDSPSFDMLCGATTATVTLSASVPTSPYTFLTSASALVNARFRDGESCYIGVISGTTSAPETQNRVPMARRIETWDRFLEDYPTCRDAAERGKVKSFATTAEAILELAGAGPSSGQGQTINVLIDDHHILDWYRTHLPVLDEELDLSDAAMKPVADHYAAARGASGRSNDADVSQDEDLSVLGRSLQLLPAAISIEPYAVVGPPASADLISDFSRFLTISQRDASGQYTGLLRRCFGRQIDRNFWFLMDFQSKVRDGNPIR